MSPRSPTRADRPKGRTPRWAQGTRAVDLAEVRALLPGWSVNRLGRGRDAIVTVDGGDAHWIIGRHADEYHAMRSMPGGSLDETSAVGGLRSARDAAALIQRTDG